MEDELIDSDRLPLSRKSLLPGAGFFYPDSIDEEASERRAREAVEGADVVVVTDSDADGLGCLALIREAYDAALDPDPFLDRLEQKVAERRGELVEESEPAPEAEAAGEIEQAAAVDEPTVGAQEEVQTTEAVLSGEEAPAHAQSRVALLPSGPRTLADDLANAAEFVDEGIDLVVSDLCPDSYEAVENQLGALVEKCDSVSWFDHHQWEDDVAKHVRDLGVELVVGESDEECATDVTLRSLDHDFDERFADLAAVTRDHDLWIKDDPRSDDLSDYSRWSDPEEYVTIVGAYGADLPDAVEEYIAERRIEKENLIDRAVDRAELKQVGPWTVGVTYGRCSQNEVADTLRDQGADAAVIVKPAGSASIRGSEDFEYCHLVARQVNGGGHPKAAGCKPDIYDDMLDYAHHWSTQGATTKRVILRAFEQVAAEEAETEESGVYED